MYLIGNYNRSAIKENRSAKDEYERLRNESIFCALPSLKLCSTSFTVTLLNTRSLRKHALDIISDRELMGNDMLCLTETHLDINENKLYLTELFAEKYRFHFNCSDNKYKSIAFLYSSQIEPQVVEDYDGVSILTVMNGNFSDNPIKIALLYKSPGMNLTIFSDMHQH